LSVCGRSRPPKKSPLISPKLENRRREARTMPKGGGFIGFEAYSSLDVGSKSFESAGTYPSKPKFEPFTPTVDSEIYLALSKVGKKDESTKLKGLIELNSLLSSRDKPTLLRFLAYWGDKFVLLTLHNSHRVRKGILAVMEALSATGMKKSFSPHLPSLLPAFLLLRSDVEHEVREVAECALRGIFPSEGRFREALVEHCQATVQTLFSFLFSEPAELCDMRCTTEEEANESCYRVRPCALQALTRLVEECSSDSGGASSTGSSSSSFSPVQALCSALYPYIKSGETPLWRVCGTTPPPPPPNTKPTNHSPSPISPSYSPS